MGVMEEEEARKDPWLRDPKVKEMKQKLEDVKDVRRDANNKMELDESNRLTKEVSKLERKLESTIAKAMKRYQKAQKAGGAEAGKTAEAPKAAGAEAGKTAEPKE